MQENNNLRNSINDIKEMILNLSELKNNDIKTFNKIKLEVTKRFNKEN